MSLATAHAPVVLADVSRAAGPLGLLIILLIGVATVLLIRNMDKRVKRLPQEFPGQAGAEPGRTGETDRS